MDSIDQIVEAVTATAEIMGQQVSATAIALIAEELSEYPSDDVSMALRRVRRSASGFRLRRLSSACQTAGQARRRRGPHSPSQTTIPAW